MVDIEKDFVFPPLTAEDRAPMTYGQPYVGTVSEADICTIVNGSMFSDCVEISLPLILALVLI